MFACSCWVSDRSEASPRVAVVGRNARGTKMPPSESYLLFSEQEPSPPGLPLVCLGDLAWVVRGQIVFPSCIV